MAHGVLVIPFITACLLFGAAPPDLDSVNAARVYERGVSCILEVSAPKNARVSFDISGYFPLDVQENVGKALYPLNTALLRPGDYLVHARISGDGVPCHTVEYSVSITPPHDGERMPVWRWGGGYSEPSWWIQRGFTGAFIGIDSPLEDPASPSATKMRAALDMAARNGYEVGFYFHPLSAKRLTKDPAVLCLLPDGTRDTETPYPLEGVVLEYARKTADSWLFPFGKHPGLRHVMLNSEYHTPFCVNDAAVELAETELGMDLRKMVANRWGPAPPAPDEVKGGIIEDENPRYRFLQWWWQRGHGTALVNRALHDIVKEHAPHLLTWHEPYRLAPVRHSHAGLDCIATWTYGYPDIKRLCYTTYLQAAARPAQQRIQQDITLFVYARYVMPLGDSTADLSRDFAGKDPFFTASPDYASEALWLVLSQRPDILCFYSAGKLSPDNPRNDPWFSSPETFDAIGRVCEEAVKPYGPLLLQCRRVAPKAALLMSAASTWFSASPRLPGYANEQTLPFASLLMMNHTPFDVLLDEDILEGGLDRYELLVMPRADTLTRSMHERIAAFAINGGKVIADKSLRADIPGAQITSFDFSHQLRMDGAALVKNEAVTAEEDRSIMEGYGRELAPLLEGVFRPCRAASPRVLVNSVEGGSAQYHFFINDDRTYGPRFGQWKLHFELGVPQQTEARIALDGRPALYDMLCRKLIEYRVDGEEAVFPLRMTAARGKLVAALPEPISRLEIEGPESIIRGQSVEFAIRIRGESGHIIEGVLPIQIEVRDSTGHRIETVPYAAAQDGVWMLRFTPAVNDALGEWTLTARELIAGQSSIFEIRVVD